ncbi:MAG: peptidoglycan-associated lipoprotein Pal [Rickettsiales bacterium]|jgi:peptidoglycan-associated lipoprotein|nr:peptidoglycan-associated lipoprotein Pal [Rickettsiales bacterium]
MNKSFLLVFSILSLAGCAVEQKIADKPEEVTAKKVPVVVAAEKPEEKSKKVVEEKAIEVPDRVFFAFDSTILDSRSKQSLTTVANWLKAKGNVTITIEGHCDERGTREYNLALGQRRAKSVKDYLISKGVAAGRIRTVSYGRERPAFRGSGEKIWSKNRRAVIVTDSKSKINNIK